MMYLRSNCYKNDMFNTLFDFRKTIEKQKFIKKIFNKKFTYQNKN